jgi:glutathione S-transferase
VLLYDSHVSGNCYKVRLLLAHLERTYERREVDVVDRSNRLDGGAYVPDDPFARAKVLQWLFFEQYSHEPYIAVVRFWVAVAQAPPAEAVLEERMRGGYAALDAMERHLARSPFLVGEDYTIADIALYAYTHVAHEGGFDLRRYPAIGSWLARVAARPRHVPITA